MGIKTPPGTTTEGRGIPGTVEKVEWEKWGVNIPERNPDGTPRLQENGAPITRKETKEGLAIYCKGWNFPRQYSVKIDATGRWESGCMAMKFADALVKLGVVTDEQLKTGWDWDNIIGRTFVFKPVHAYLRAGQKLSEDPNDITHRQVWLPVETVDASAGSDAPPATDPIEELTTIVTKAGPTGITPEELSKTLIQTDPQLAELFYTGLREKFYASGRVVNRNGRLYAA